MAIARLPVFSLMLGILALAMLGPGVQAAGDGDWRIARAFLYAGLFTLVAAGIFGFALATLGHGGAARRELTVLLLCWVFVPVFAAIPLMLSTPAIGVGGAVFEMTAAFTTTGGTVYGDLSALPRAINLWRGTVGWLGGLLTLSAAYVVLAPRRLGGFEIEAAAWARRGAGQSSGSVSLGAVTAPLESRIARAVPVILTRYLGLTVVLGLLLSASGQDHIDSMVHAMSVLSTSGISPRNGGLAEVSSWLAELAVFVFLVLAASRAVYAAASEQGRRQPWRHDPELWTMAALIGSVTVSLFLRHWIGALGIDLQGAVLSGIEALWGAVFTTLSFLTTTGFVSAAWHSARDWSGWANPGLILLALAAIGGGAATTAGGIKLIRAYALFRHGLRELDRIAQPNAVLGYGEQTRSLLRQGSVIVWAFMMLFIFAILVGVLGLTWYGMRFEQALIAAIAAISNTGPAYALVAEGTRGFIDLGGAQRVILGALMIVGRIETLALIALFNPDLWQAGRNRAKKSGKSAGETAQSGW